MGSDLWLRLTREARINIFLFQNISLFHVEWTQGSLFPDVKHFVLLFYLRQKDFSCAFLLALLQLVILGSNVSSLHWYFIIFFFSNVFSFLRLFSNKVDWESPKRFSRQPSSSKKKVIIFDKKEIKRCFEEKYTFDLERSM